MIRAIFFDIDGTMVSYKNKIMSQQLRDDLFALQRAGIRIFVCSGRAPQDLESTGMLRDVVFDGYITLNGQCCFNAQGVYRDNPLPLEDLRNAKDVLEAHPELAALVEENGVSYLTCHNRRVDEVFEFLHTKQYPVLSAQRMIGDEGTQATVARQVLLAVHVDPCVQKVQTGLEKVHPNLVARLAQENVQFVLMDNAFQVRHHETGNVLRLPGCLFAQYLVHVDQE